MASQIKLTINTIERAPELRGIVDAYYAELERRLMPTTWPKSDLIHIASLIHNDEPITMMMFAPLKLLRDEDSVGGNVYVAGAYTRPSWRRCGLYRDLFDIMVNQWRKEDKYDWLRSGFHLSNDQSRATQLSQGREFYEIKDGYQRTRLSLRPTGQEYDLTAETLEPILSKIERLS